MNASSVEGTEVALYGYRSPYCGASPPKSPSPASLGLGLFYTRRGVMCTACKVLVVLLLIGAGVLFWAISVINRSVPK